MKTFGETMKNERKTYLVLVEFLSLVQCLEDSFLER